MSKQYLFQVKILSKKDKHPLESIAYYSGEKQYDVTNTKAYDSTTADRVIWRWIFIPDRINQNEAFFNLPEYLKFRSKKVDMISNARNILWQGVNNKDIRPDSQFARLFELAIPHFLDQEERTNLMMSFGNILVKEGMIPDASIHNHNKKIPELSLIEKLKIVQTPKEGSDLNDKPQDYTGFFMCTLRDYKDGMFVNKNRNWNNALKLKEWRSLWVDLLSNSIENAKNASDEERKSWENKLKIYPEYTEKRKYSM